MRRIGEQAYDQSIADLKGNIYLLGMNSIHLINVMKWHERVASLVTERKFVQVTFPSRRFEHTHTLGALGVAMPKYTNPVASVCFFPGVTRT